MIRWTKHGRAFGRQGILAVLGYFLLVPAAHARSLEAAIEELGSQLGRQLANQQVRSFGALQFVNLDGPQTLLEEQIADAVARRIGQAGGSATFIGLTPSEAARAKFALPPGANISGETAARVAKLAGAEAMLIGTVRRIDSQSVELVGQIFSAQRGVILADGRTTFDGSMMAQAPPTPAPSQAEPPVYFPPPEPRNPAPSNAPQVVTIEAGQFMIELDGCRRSSASVDCSFVLLNQAANADFTIFNGKTRLFDDRGREYEPSIVVIADQRADIKGYAGNRLQKQIISGVRTRASIHFPDVDAGARSISSLQLNLHAPRAAQGEFRSIPILGDESSAPSSAQTPSGGGNAPEASGSAVQRTEAGQFLVELMSCSRQQAGVRCNFVLTNQGANADFTIFNGKTRLFDDHGREYEPSIVVIADQRADLKGYAGKRLQKQVIGGVPTQASIHFPNVASDARSIASLQINLHAPRAANAEFRSIPIQ